MTAPTAPQPPAAAPPTRPRRRRRWLRWTIAGLGALVILLVALIAVAVKLQPTPAPLTLPAAATPPAGPVDGPVDGTYQAAPGSVAGFRVRQTVIGLTSEVVGRTTDVTGTVTVAAGRATTARLRVGLRALTSGGANGDAKPAPQFGISLDTGRYPDATISLARPVPLGPAFTSGSTVTVDAAGTLTLRGVERAVTVGLSLRRTGTGIDVTGTVPVTFADYGIARPTGYGALGSLADRGTAEFLLVLRRA